MAASKKKRPTVTREVIYTCPKCNAVVRRTLIPAVRPEITFNRDSQACKSCRTGK